MTDKEKIKMMSMFKSIKGISPSADVDTDVDKKVTRINIKLIPENNLIKRLFKEYNDYILDLTKVSIDVSLEDIESESIIYHDKTGVSDEIEIINHTVRVTDGVTVVETQIESLEPIPIKEWKGVLDDNTTVTTSVLADPTLASDDKEDKDNTNTKEKSK